MTNSGEETVGGDFLVNYLYGSNDNYGRTKPFYNGKITVGGNAEMYNFSVTPHIYEDFTFIFDGTKDLTLRNIYSGNIVINNAADRKITFAENIQAAKLSGGDMSVTPENLIFGATLENDVTVNGDMRVARAWIYRESQYSSYSYSNDLNLNGHKLTVNGNVMQTDGLLNINNGQLDISGNYDINNSASINMSKADDRVNVSGDMSVNSSCASTLTDGILSLKGDFTQDGTKNSKNFLASGNHMTYLDGNGLQKITFGTYPSSKFNNVELFQFEENYMFSPEVCWNNMRIHCDHTNTEIRDAVEVTCLENGYSGDTYCADCGDLLETGTVIKATGHKTVIDEAIAASCTEDGKTAGRHCSECGAVFKAQEVIYATGHKGEWTVVKEATCSEEGREEIVCTVCGEMDSRAIEKLPHTEETMKSVAPTCTKAGLSEGKKCSVCGEILEEQQTINALGHTYEATVVEPTCISGGYTVYTCSVCGDTYRSDYTGISEHEYRRIVTQEATCKNEGIAKYICIVCSDTYTETIARTEHSIVTDNAVESTCTTEGLTQGSHCSVCGEVFVAQEKIKAKEHTPSKAIKENIIVSTYTRAGSYENVVYCSVCNAEISRKKVTLAKLPKKANTLTVKGKTATVKYSSLKKNNQTVAQKNAFTISKAQGKVTYKKSSGNSKITVSSAGKITVKKGLKKGTYTVKVKVSAAGNATYTAATKTATVTIKVK